VTFETSTFQRESDRESVLLVTTAAVRTPAAASRMRPRTATVISSFPEMDGFLPRPSCSSITRTGRFASIQHIRNGPTAISPASGAKRCEHGVEQPDCAGLVQRFVAVATLRRLDARRASGLALAGCDGLPGRAQPLLGRVVPAGGEAGAARLPVIDEHRHPVGVWVQRRGDPPDVPPIAGG